jgi:hypothetical protein
LIIGAISYSKETHQELINENAAQSIRRRMYRDRLFGIIFRTSSAKSPWAPRRLSARLPDSDYSESLLMLSNRNIFIAHFDGTIIRRNTLPLNMSLLQFSHTSLLIALFYQRFGARSIRRIKLFNREGAS